MAAILTLVLAACSSSAETTITSTTGGTSGAAGNATTEGGTTADPVGDGGTGNTDTGTTDDAGAEGAAPAAPPEDSAAAAIVETSSFGNELTLSELACVVSRLEDDTAMALAFNQVSDFEELPVDDQVTATLAVFDCAPDLASEAFTAGFTESAGTMDAALFDGVGDCMVNFFSEANPSREQVARGFLLIQNGAAELPPETHGPITDLLANCVPSEVFVELVLVEAASDPTFGTALDEACLRTSFNDDVVRTLWAGLVESGALTGGGMDLDPTAPDGPLAPVLDALFDCLSFGQILASQAAATGATISDSSVACIDAELAGEDIVALTSDPGNVGITEVLTTCLTPEELVSLGG